MGQAAQRLHVTQPAISRAVQALERELGVRLLARQSSGSFLTDQGLVLARRTRRFFTQLDAALEEVAALEPQSVARLSRKISDIHMRCVLAIGATRSFRRAAKALGIAEPTLHRPARELERLLRVPLFVRTREGIGLSPKGTELARRFSLCIGELVAGIEELSSAAQSTLNVGVLPLAPKSLLARSLESTVKTWPNSRFVVREGSYEELAAGLRSGTIDLIFGALRAPSPYPDLREESLFDDSYRVVCRRGHPLLGKARKSIRHLADYDWIFATSDLPRRAVLDEIIGNWKLSRRVQLETNSLGTLASVISLSDRISLLPREYIQLEAHSNTLAVLDIEVPQPRRVVGLTLRRDWLPTGMQSEFLNQLRRVSAERDASAQSAAGVLVGLG